MTCRILLVEDESGIAVVVRDLLQAAGHQVEVASDGVEGLRMSIAGGYDLLILDVMLPSLSGLDICQTLRERGYDGAVLMLTAKGQVLDRVAGLRGGADDYVVKPFSPEELVARVEALLRRVHKAGPISVRTFQFGNVAIDFVKFKASRQLKPVALTGKEWDLLRLLVNHRGQVLTRETILNQVWAEQKFITPRTVDVHIAWLRQKLEDNPQAPAYILTVRGEGYRFVP